LLYINTYIILTLLNKGENIISFHMNLKDIEQEKQIRTTLFQITHEIKNPLAVCKGYLDMFNINNHEHTIKYIPIIKGEVKRALTILQDFLDLTKIKVDKSIMDINMLLEDITLSLTPLFKQYNITPKITITDEEVFINGDYDRLKQVIINVVKNSVEAIPKTKKGIIKLSTYYDKKYFKIIIEDNGCGMSEETLKKVKTPFYTTKTNGTGLGVSLSNEIVTNHEGKLEYTSVIKKGTKVTISLPFEKIYT